MTKYVDLIGWDDCPHLREPNITKEELDEFERRMLPHQRQARRTGRPSLGAGAVYPVDEDLIFVEPFKIPKFWEWGWAMDPGWNVTAALVGARDPDTDTIYLTHEHYQGSQSPIEHAHTIKRMLPWPLLEGGIDPAADQSNQKDGSKLLLEYEDLGLQLVKAVNQVNAGLFHVLTLMQGGGLKVFSTLRNWQKEYRLYRRDEKGKIVKKNDHLMDCTRYLTMTPGLFVSRPIQRARRAHRGEW